MTQKKTGQKKTTSIKTTTGSTKDKQRQHKPHKISISKMYPKASTRTYMKGFIKKSGLNVDRISTDAVDAVREILAADTLRKLIVSYRFRPPTQLAIRFGPNEILKKCTPKNIDALTKIAV